MAHPVTMLQKGVVYELTGKSGKFEQSVGLFGSEESDNVVPFTVKGPDGRKINFLIRILYVGREWFARGKYFTIYGECVEGKFNPSQFDVWVKIRISMAGLGNTMEVSDSPPIVTFG